MTNENTPSGQITMDLIRAAFIAIVQNLTVAVTAFGVFDMTTEQSGIIIALVNNVLTFSFMVWSVIRALKKVPPATTARSRRSTE